MDYEKKKNTPFKRSKELQIGLKSFGVGRAYRMLHAKDDLCSHSYSAVSHFSGKLYERNTKLSGDAVFEDGLK